MAKHLSWQRSEQKLSLEGELNSDTLLPLWDQRRDVISGITIFELSGLTRVDTAGLALLIHLIEQVKQQGNSIELRQVSENLRTLVQLYNLSESVFPRCSV